MLTPFMDAIGAGGPQRGGPVKRPPETPEDQRSFMDELEAAPDKDDLNPKDQRSTADTEIDAELSLVSSPPPITPEASNASELIPMIDTEISPQPADTAVAATTARAEVLADTPELIEMTPAEMREPVDARKLDDGQTIKTAPTATQTMALELGDQSLGGQTGDGAETAATKTQAGGAEQAIDIEFGTETTEAESKAKPAPAIDTVQAPRASADEIASAASKSIPEAKSGLEKAAASSATPLPAAAPLTAQAAPTMQTVSNIIIPQEAAPTVVASPGDIPDIVARTVQSQDAGERVVVQLDPPELGRVIVDFKIDTDGVQTVTVTAETPEAVKRLRQMNFELVQAMEQNGLSGRNFSLEYQQSDQGTKNSPFEFDDGEETFGIENSGLIAAKQTRPAHMPPGASLNLKL